MKRETILWIVGAAAVGAALFALGSLFTLGSAATQGPPTYSLSAGSAGMLGGGGYYYDFVTTDSWPPEEVTTDVQAYLDRQNNPDLVLARLRQFDLAYQADIVERSTGRHAFGLMVSAAQISPEAGPNVFWNTKYGPLIAEVGGGYGMLGRLLPQESADEMPVTAAEARSIAAEAIPAVNNDLSGSAEATTPASSSDLSLGDETATFYGFYEFSVLQAGEPVGELDVNGYSGQTWFKDWGRPPLSTQDVTPAQ
ncbi:MAG: hypothetical protein K8L99_02895 [Anaerolineae bacterium]|nr:hypothetical protein [Anaerolineae bacterium]